MFESNCVNPIAKPRKAAAGASGATAVVTSPTIWETGSKFGELNEASRVTGRHGQNSLGSYSIHGHIPRDIGLGPNDNVLNETKHPVLEFIAVKNLKTRTS